MKGTWQGSGTWQTSGGGPGLVALVLVLGVIAAILHAIWHTIIEAAEIAAIVVVSVIGAAALAGAVYAVLRIRARVIGQRPPSPSQSALSSSRPGPAGKPREFRSLPRPRLTRRYGCTPSSSPSSPRSSAAISGRSKPAPDLRGPSSLILP